MEQGLPPDNPLLALQRPTTVFSGVTPLILLLFHCFFLILLPHIPFQCSQLLAESRVFVQEEDLGRGHTGEGP